MKQKRQQPLFTAEDLKLINKMTDAYITQLDKEWEKVDAMINYGYDIGEVSGSGEKYTQNLPLFELRQKIREHLTTEKERAIRLRNTIYVKSITP